MYCSTRSTVPSTWIPSANPPISITSLSQLVCPKFVNALLSLIASLLVYAPLYHLVGHRQSSFDHVTSSSSSSSSIILLLFRVLVFSTTFDREFIGHHRVSSSPARQPIIVNSSSAQLASPSLPAQYCPIIARTHHRPDYSAHQTNKLYSVNIFFFSIIHPQFRHRFHY